MTVIFWFEKSTVPPDSLYCSVKTLLEPAVIEIVETVLCCTWGGMNVVALDEMRIAAVVSLAAIVVVPLTAKLRNPPLVPAVDCGAISPVTITITWVVVDLLSVTVGLGVQPVVPYVVVLYVHDEPAVADCGVETPKAPVAPCGPVTP